MKSTIHRRQFLGYSASLGICSGMIPSALSAKHHKSERFTVGLSQYLFVPYCVMGLWMHLISLSLQSISLE